MQKDNIKQIINDCYKNGIAYEEYAIVYYAFIRRLYSQLIDDKRHAVAFLSREGYFLKELFEIYQGRFEDKNKFVTTYFCCSRNAITGVQPNKRKISNFNEISVREFLYLQGFNDDEIETMESFFDDIDKEILDFPNSNEARILSEEPRIKSKIEKRVKENEYAFAIYVKDLLKRNNVDAIVDIGWTGRMQHGIEEYLNEKICGYYLGIYDNTNDPEQSQRKGLIFHHIQGEGKSKYFDLLRSNTLLYELLSAAPHGSCRNYRYFDSEVTVSMKWDENEKRIYETRIKQLQDKLKIRFLELCETCSGMDEDQLLQYCAYIVIRSGLIPDRKRMMIMHEFNLGFCDNFEKQRKGAKFSPNQVQINMKTLLFNIVQYTQYFVKLPEVFYVKKMRMLYYPLGFCIFGLIKVKAIGILRKH